MLNSQFRTLCSVQLPFQNRQHYMHGFDLSNPTMLEGYGDYLEPVSALIEAAGARVGTAYMTVDERIIEKGHTQRKPHPHVDGCFIPSYNRWSHSSWNHYCNNLPLPRMAVIVASNIAACRVWRGQFEAVPTEMGDLSHIRDLLDDGEMVPANSGALLSPDCVHESLPMTETVQRTFLRIALPVEFVGNFE